jgi:hypothetical protein
MVMYIYIIHLYQNIKNDVFAGKSKYYINNLLIFFLGCPIMFFQNVYFIFHIF